MSIDLHVHSTYSDGSLMPNELVELANRKGLKAISITDHDNISSTKYIVELMAVYDITMVTGVELSLKHNDISIHLLVYCFDQNNEKLLELLSIIQAGRDLRNKQILSALHNIGFKLEGSELYQFNQNSQIGRPHFAKLLVQKKFAKNINEAFSKYLVPGCKTYYDTPEVQLIDVLPIVHEAKGLAVLAHPLSNKLFRDNLETNISNMSSIGLHGIEAYYPTHSKKSRNVLLTLAMDNQMIVTGGSDYHGAFRKGTRMAGGKNVTVPYNVLNHLLKKHKSLYGTGMNGEYNA